MTEDHHCKNINNINLQNLELQHSPVYAGIIDFRENKYLAKCVLNEDHIQKIGLFWIKSFMSASVLVTLLFLIFELFQIYKR